MDRLRPRCSRVPNPSTTPEARETPPQALAGTFNGREAALRRGLPSIIESEAR